MNKTSTTEKLPVLVSFDNVSRRSSKNSVKHMNDLTLITQEMVKNMVPGLKQNKAIRFGQSAIYLSANGQLVQW